MNRFFTITVLAVSALVLCASCDKDVNTDSPYIEGLTIDNYPVVDGSTSTLPLNRVIACELMRLSYEWEETREWSSSTWSIEPKIKGGQRRKFDNVIKSSQTHNSFLNVIDGEAEIALSARTMSANEKAYAETQGVTLIETPIALDAFIFIVSPQNPVTSLTIEDIQHIYTGKATLWKEFGVEIEMGYDEAPIQPFIRNANAGSQELMDLLVMNGMEYYKELPIYQENLIFTMAGLIDEIANRPLAIGYTVYYYNEQIIRPGDYLKTIGIDGVKPTKQTISNRSYPLTTEVYAVIRSDLDKSSLAYQIYEWLQTSVGKQAISKSGYIPN